MRPWWLNLIIYPGTQKLDGKSNAETATIEERHGTPSVARKRAWVGITPGPSVGIVPVVTLVVVLLVAQVTRWP